MPKSKPGIHYIWCGPPPPLAKYKGHDTIGPDLLHEAHPGEPIDFWCLKAHLGSYQQHFNNKPVQVHAIEDFMDENESVCPELRTFFENIKAAAVAHESPKDTAREYTTLKVLTQLYLQHFYSGYFLDSNIIPNPDTEGGPIPQHDKFSYPFFTDANINRADPWLMFSPADDHDGLNRLLFFLKGAKKEFESREHLDAIDRTYLGKLFVSTVEQTVEKTIIPVKKTEGGQDTVLCEAFLKRYYNTHRAVDDYIAPPVLSNIISGAPSSYRELQYLLSMTEQDCSEPFRWGSYSKGLHTTTLLHESMLVGDLDAFTILLDSARTLNKKIPITGLGQGQYSILDLAIYTAREEDEYDIMILMILKTMSDKFFKKNAVLFFKTLDAIMMSLGESSLLVGDWENNIEKTYDMLVQRLYKTPAQIEKWAIDAMMAYGPITKETMGPYKSVLKELSGQDHLTDCKPLLDLICDEPKDSHSARLSP